MCVLCATFSRSHGLIKKNPEKSIANHRSSWSIACTAIYHDSSIHVDSFSCWFVQSC